MKTHITTLNNMAGTASLAHRRVLKVAQSIGCHEMGLSFYPLKPDYAKEIDKRLDGIIAPLNYGDIVIFQYPTRLLSMMGKTATKFQSPMRWIRRKR